MILNINSREVVAFTNKLEKLHKSALPSAIRGTLNKAAFATKQDTLIKSAKNSFTERQPNFFKANSRVDIAKGFSIKTMQSTVGMMSEGLKGGNNYAVRDLEEQEQGGIIKKKSFIPMGPARSGGYSNKLVKANARLAEIKKKGIVNVKNGKGKNDKEKFVKSVIHAGKGGFVLANYKGSQILWRVNSLSRGKKSGAFKLTPLYSVEKSRSIHVNATHFMKNASLTSWNRMQLYFQEEAERQINKFK